MQPQVKKLVFMGGTINGKGNVSPVAEFNVHADPEAAHVVLSAFKVIADHLSMML